MISGCKAQDAIRRRRCRSRVITVLTTFLAVSPLVHCIFTTYGLLELTSGPRSPISPKRVASEGWLPEWYTGIACMTANLRTVRFTLSIG